MRGGQVGGVAGRGGAGQRWHEGAGQWAGHERGMTGSEIASLHGFHKLLQIPWKRRIRYTYAHAC